MTVYPLTKFYRSSIIFTDIKGWVGGGWGTPNEIGLIKEEDPITFEILVTNAVERSKELPYGALENSKGIQLMFF